MPASNRPADRGTQPNPLMVSISARHCHVTQEALDMLCGPGHQLTVHKPLYQTGHSRRTKP
jgi:propanediol utilization protein